MDKRIEVQGLSFEPYISTVNIQKRIIELATEISEEYRELQPVFLPILNGAFMFMADLYRHIQIPSELSFLKVSSYEGVQSTGEVKSLLGLSRSIEGRHVLIVEDIVDTGTTLQWLISDLEKQSPASIEVVSLLIKPEALQHPIDVKYVGFGIPNVFVLGYGLDYHEEGRNLPEIYKVVESKN